MAHVARVGATLEAPHPLYPLYPLYPFIEGTHMLADTAERDIVEREKERERKKKGGKADGEEGRD